MSARPVAVIVAAIALAAVAGCGVGPGEGERGEAQLTVTRDFGAEPMLAAESEDPSGSETVVRFLDREAEVETSYGGNFVDSIDGVSGRVSEGLREDWFFFVNGYWSPVGAGEAKVRAGDRIWWDYRAWEQAYRVPAVVGSWPEPFLHGFDGERFDTRVVCFRAPAACEAVRARLADEGIEAEAVEAGASGTDGNERTLRVLVGAWDRVREDATARQLESGPERSGVYAAPRRCRGGWELVISGPDGRPRAVAGASGFVAAVRAGAEQPSWIVSAGAVGELDGAVGLLAEDVLRDRYAVAAGAEGPLAVPAPAADPVVEADC